MHAFLGLMLAVAVTVRQKFGIEEYISINRLHDLAKMTFAFSLLWTYMGYSQYLVIWYADLPEETPYLVIRSMNAPWNTLFVVIILWVFVSVFLGLLPRSHVLRNLQGPNLQTYRPNHFQSVFWPGRYQV